MADPIHQFELKTIATLGKIGGSQIAFTNSSLYMLGAVGLITLFMLWGTSSRAMVPGRIQSMVELCYEFVADTVRSSAGKEGMMFFPLVFSLFMFILVLNLAGMLPYGFTVTSHIIITLRAAGAWGILSPLPLALTVALTALEMLVAVLQAYVFATLTSIYLHDALHPGH